MTRQCRHCNHCNSPWESDWDYCPVCDKNFGGAIYPEQQTSQELAEINRLVTLIKEAFANVQLEDGLTLHEADLEGVYYPEGARMAARQKDTESHWSEVPDWKIERLNSALSFLDVKGWRFYIPAYMIWTLKNWRFTDSVTSEYVVWEFEPRFDDLCLPRFESLTNKQAIAVAQFVQYFCDYDDNLEQRRAMAKYWHRYLNTGSVE